MFSSARTTSDSTEEIVGVSAERNTPDSVKRSVAAPSESGVLPNHAGAPWIVPDLTVSDGAENSPSRIMRPPPVPPGLAVTAPAEVTEASRCVEVEDGVKVAPFAPAVTAGSASVPAVDSTVGTAYGPSSNASVPPLSVTADGESDEIFPTVRVAPSETVPFAVSVDGKMTWSPAASVGSVSQLDESPQVPPPLVRHVWTVEAAGAKVTLSSSVEELSAVTVKVATKPGKRESMRYFEVSKQPVGPDMTFHVPATG